MTRITIPGFDLDQHIIITRHSDGGFSAFGKPATRKVGGSRAECVRCIQLVGRGCGETLGWRIIVPGHGVRTVCWTCADEVDSAEPTPSAPAKPRALQPRSAASVADLVAIFSRAMDAAKHNSQAIAYVVASTDLRRAHHAEEDGDAAEALRILRDVALPKIEARSAELHGRLARFTMIDRRTEWEAAELDQIALDMRALADRLSA